MQKIVCYSIALTISFFVSSCDWLSYNHPLGGNLSLWDGDKKEDRFVVYCEGDCYGGIYVVPTYARHYDSNGRYAEYVETAKSNKEWVIIQTLHIKERQKNYYIVSKKFDITNVDCSNVSCGGNAVVGFSRFVFAAGDQQAGCDEK